jgi:hypothetical protein
MDAFTITIEPCKEDINQFISEVHEKLNNRLEEVTLLSGLGIKSTKHGVEYLHNSGIRFIIPPTSLLIQKTSDIKDGDIEIVQVLVNNLVKEIEKKEIKIIVSLSILYPFESYKKEILSKLGEVPKFRNFEVSGMRFHIEDTSLILDKTSLSLRLRMETKLSEIDKSRIILKLFEDSQKILREIRT